MKKNRWIIWGIASIVILIFFWPLGMLSLAIMAATAIIGAIRRYLDDIHTIAENTKKK